MLAGKLIFGEDYHTTYQKNIKLNAFSHYFSNDQRHLVLY